MTRILLVEDQFLIRSLMAESLVGGGFEVTEADAGAEAVSHISSFADLDLLITDIQMPGETDGNIVARKAKAKFSGLPVIYMTGNPSSVMQQLGSRDAIMKKPFSPEELVLVARRLIAASEG